MSEVPLSLVAEINPRSYPPSGLKLSDPVSFIPMADVSASGDWTGDKRGSLAASAGYTTFQEGDVLLAKITPCLENGKGAHAIGLCNEYGYGSTEFHVLRAKGGNSDRYLFHITQHMKFRLKAEMQMTGTAGQRRVPTDFFDRYCAWVPSKAYQSKIAEILDTLDAAIRETEAVVAKLKAMKQGLLHDLLTRGIDANGDLRLSQSEAPHLYKQTPLGWLPKEWEACLLDNVALRGSGHTPSKSIPSYWEGGIRWVSLADSHRLDQVYIRETDKEISEAGLANSSAVRHPENTVILSRDAGIGKSAILASEMAVSQHFMAWRCGTKLNHVFLYYLLQREKPRFEAIAMGSTIKTIGLSFFKKYVIALPPKNEQDQIGKILLQAEDDVVIGEQELQKLRATKSGLMDDLLTGRTSVTPLL